jgi:hypothetical protein
LHFTFTVGTLMNPAETQAFFEAYRDAFNRLDGDAVADLWHSSSGITDTPAQGAHAGLTWWPEAGPMRANHRALCALYRQAGYGQAQFVMEHCVPMGPNHAFAHLRWTLTRADGSLLQQFHTGYQLLRTAQGPRVLLAVAYAENLSAMRGGGQ